MWLNKSILRKIEKQHWWYQLNKDILSKIEKQHWWYQLNKKTEKIKNSFSDNISKIIEPEYILAYSLTTFHILTLYIFLKIIN